MCVCEISERVKHQYKGLKKSVVKPIFLRLFFDKVINKNKNTRQSYLRRVFSRKIFLFSE